MVVGRSFVLGLTGLNRHRRQVDLTVPRSLYPKSEYGRAMWQIVLEGCFGLVSLAMQEKVVHAIVALLEHSAVQCTDLMGPVALQVVLSEQVHQWLFSSCRALPQHSCDLPSSRSGSVSSGIFPMSWKGEVVLSC